MMCSYEFADLGIFKRIYLVCWNDFQAGPSNWFRPMYVDRMFLLVIGILTNIGLDVYGMVERPTDFASYILAIFITNLMLYTMFYIIMKLRHGEKIHKMPLLFIALSTVSWAAAMYFFINKAITWRVSKNFLFISQLCTIIILFVFIEKSCRVQTVQSRMPHSQLLRFPRHLALSISRQPLLFIHGNYSLMTLSVRPLHEMILNCFADFTHT